MPHILIEYTAGLASDAQLESLLDALHATLASSALFEPDHIRLRAGALHHYRCAGAKLPFIHVQCRIHRGRTSEQKRRLSSTVLATLQQQQWPVRTITVEVVEMERESYSKFTQE